MKRFLLIAALVSLSAVAQAQTPTCAVGAPGVAPVATISFTPPTVNTDGTAVATPLTYNVYQSSIAGAEVKVASALKGAPISVSTGLTPNSTVYWKISVVDANGKESALSNEVCKSFPASTPGSVTITVT